MSACKLLHPYSAGVGAFETDLFSIPSTQLSIDESAVIEISPFSTFDGQDTPLEFLIPSSSELFVDPTEIYLYIKGKIVNGNGTSIASGDEVYLENQFLSTFFTNLEVFLNDVSTSLGPTHYAIQNYIGTLINYGPGAKNGHLTSTGYYESFDEHKDRFSKSTDKIFDVYGPVHNPIFNQPKMILNGVDIRLKFTRAEPAYYLRTLDSAVANKKPYVKILETFLMVKKARLTPNTFLNLESKLRSMTAKYAIDRIDTKITTLASGSNSVSIDNLILGNLPKKIIVCFQNNNILNGSYLEDTFDFKNFDLSNLSLFVNGNLISKPYDCTFAKDDTSLPLVSRPFLSLLANINGLDAGGNSLSITDFNKNKAIFAFNLEQSFDDCFTLINPVRSGTISLKLQFKTPLANVISCITLLQFASLIEIDATRNIMVRQ